MQNDSVLVNSILQLKPPQKTTPAIKNGSIEKAEDEAFIRINAF